MATAIKAFEGDWDEPLTSENAWRRQGRRDAVQPAAGDDVVIKRTVHANQLNLALADDLDAWTRVFLRARPLHPANRDDPNYAAIEAQVVELREYALEDGAAFSEVSATAVLRFCHELAADYEPAIFLMVNGNLRAVWQNETRDQIAIQFMPNGLLQYVMLRDRQGLTLKALGEDVNEDKILHTAEVQELTGLWYVG